ncbi:hypothetical protein [Streptomyces durhamensis]|uniref:hypothetical protein n=1 Tax=Streptomyces durhamensis TaxID=68194 RepID=UPI0004CCA4EA|nr:hypothetical protein [Streptomyces durhamensis]
MELRRELLPPSVPAERLAELAGEIERIDTLLREDEEAGRRAVGAFNEATGHSYGPGAFLDRWAARDLREFALEAARPAWPRVPDITRDELTEIVRRMRAAYADGDPDADHYRLVLEVNVAHPDSFTVAEQEATPACIVDELLAYRPIAL